MDHRRISAIEQLSPNAEKHCFPDASARLFEPWRVESRRLLSVPRHDRLVCRVSLVPVNGIWPDWRAGDEAETRSAVWRGQAIALAHEFRGGLQVASHAAAALLPRGHSLEPIRLVPQAATSLWPIASVRREGTLDLLLIAENSDPQLAEIPQYLLTDMTIALRVRPRPSFHLHAGRRILVMDSFGLATARAWLAESFANPRSELIVLLVCPPDLADAAVGREIRALVDLGRARVERVPVGGGRREFAAALRRADRGMSGRLNESTPVLIAGRPDIADADEASAAICSLGTDRQRARRNVRQRFIGPLVS